MSLRVSACLLVLLSPVLPCQDGAGAPEPYVESIGVKSTDFKMVPIPAGIGAHSKTVTIGSPETEVGRRSDEGPRVVVEVAPFWMASHETTWDLYNLFRREYAQNVDERLQHDKVEAAAWADAVSIPTPLWEQDSAPILQGLGMDGGFPCADISQLAARQFTKWLSKKTGRFYRLPTEAEWEYAARAGTTTAFYFGDDAAQLGEHAWYFDNSAYDDPDRGYPGLGAGYRKVGLKKPNPFGLYDIYGNVAEWVIDAWSKDGYGAPSSVVAKAADVVRWPTAIFPCVVRGGHWEADAADCRSAARLCSEPKWQSRDPQIPKSIWWFTDAFHVGFRVVRPLIEPSESEKLRYWDAGIEAVDRIIQSGGKQARIPVRARPAGVEK